MKKRLGIKAIITMLSGIPVFAVGSYIADNITQAYNLGSYITYFGGGLIVFGVIFLMLLSGDMQWIDDLGDYFSPLRCGVSLIIFLLLHLILQRDDIKENPSFYIATAIYIVSFFGFLYLIGQWLKPLRLDEKKGTEDSSDEPIGDDDDSINIP
ncbi:MAG: hypothetical protein ACYDCO_09940 [Armatimonadota bacterium]